MSFGIVETNQWRVTFPSHQFFCLCVAPTCCLESWECGQLLSAFPGNWAMDDTTYFLWLKLSTAETSHVTARAVVGRLPTKYDLDYINWGTFTPQPVWHLR
jgi:hypothetical protein